MTRINTNVSSLVGRNNLNRANAGLSQALTRLSTGLRINTGKDDPAGLIASENLRSDITSIQRAIGNTDRANQVIATADSALGQVSSLLNDIRGLVTESANSGALSDAQIQANQSQIDSSLEALNRIAQTTTFQGRKLLDGSLNFNTTAGTNFNQISNLEIDQANLGATGSVSVDVDVATAATQAQVDVTDIPTTVAAVTASDGTLTFATAGAAATGTLTLASGDEIDITAAADGADFNDVAIEITDGNGGNSASYDAGTNTISVTIDISGGDTTADLQGLIDGLAEFGASTSDSAALQAGDETTFNNVTSGGVDEVDAEISISPTEGGASFNRTITFDDSGDLGDGVVNVTDDGTTLTVAVDDDSAIDLSDLVTAIETALDANDDFDVSLTDTTGDGEYNAAEDTAPTVANVGATTAGADSYSGITEDLVFQLSGLGGSEVFNVKAGSSLDDLVNQIESVKDATGVTATANGTTLELRSTEYGSDAFVDIAVLSEGSGSVNSGTFTDAISAGSRQVGSDVIAKVNGIDARGVGNELSINTATLDLTTTVSADFTGSIDFTITGGGALFQLGPEVVSNQQARLGITSVNTASLGGVSGKLYQLQSGGSADLKTSASTAADIVGEAIDQVTSLRGRLGAFQRTTLETNKNALNDTLANLTEAESSIRDADFAAETAALTRSQILVQSGTRVLAIANQNPQNALSLLG